MDRQEIRLKLQALETILDGEVQRLSRQGINVSRLRKALGLVRSLQREYPPICHSLFRAIKGADLSRRNYRKYKRLKQRKQILTLTDLEKAS